MNTEKEKVLFWYEDPNILLNQKYIFEFFPTEHMGYKQQLNAITRTIIILTVLLMLITPNFRILLVSLITIVMIYLMYYFRNKEEIKEGLEELEMNDSRGNPEPYNEDELEQLEVNDRTISSNGNPTDELIDREMTGVFAEVNSENPLNNVMINDYNDSAGKKPAPPSSSKNTQNNLLESAKKLVQEINNEQPNITDKLFHDLGEKINLEHSMRPYYSNPSTTIPNDQTAFANFCYGNMTSCKENNPFACAKNASRYTNY
jgi:Ca2+/Na+ antiporter|tara:strand:- start:1820 stop:2599 length:780 start_codon:yes stop_codon:yes gene_type:complete